MPSTEPTSATCPVCAEPAGVAPQLCPLCETPHHFDCWEWGGGCGVYGCRARVAPRSAPPPEDPALPGKLGMPQKRAGTYEGRLWAPPAAVLTLFLAQLLWMLALVQEAWDVFGVNLAVYLFCWFWILSTSVHFYVDFERRRISQAKAVLGRDVWEWEVLPLDQVEVLELRPRPCPGGPDRVAVLAIPKDAAAAPLELSPSLEAGSSEHREMLDLFRRIQASGAFPARATALLPPPPREAA